MMQTVRDIEFISYDGDYPNLCRGTLTLRIEGEEISVSRSLMSGGECWCGATCYTTQGDWTVDFNRFPVELNDIEKKIVTELVNKNVEHGCCGGCI